MKHVFAFCFLLVMIACTSTRATSEGARIGLRNLNHYDLTYTLPLTGNYNGIVVTDDANFTRLFQPQTTGEEPVRVPDFNGQLVVALAPNTAQNNRVVFTRAEIKGNQINVFGRLKTAWDNTVDAPVAVATVPRYSDAKRVNFYIEKTLVKTVPVSLKNKTTTG